MDWPLPPDLPWPDFLRRLRAPSPPKGWLEAAAALPELQRRPLLLRWIAQHRQAPTHLRLNLLAKLPWPVLLSVAEDPQAHPQARSIALERLQPLWAGLNPGGRRSFALRAPRAFWESVWSVPDTRVLGAFLNHPKLGLEALLKLIRPPLHPSQAEALLQSRWRELLPVIHHVLRAMDATFQSPDSRLVLGQAAPWLKALTPDERLHAAQYLSHPPLRRMARAWSGRRSQELDPDLPPNDASPQSGC